MEQGSIEQLIEAGEWREAAERLALARRYEDAEGLYLKLLDRRAAAQMARACGRDVDAMRHLLAGRHQAEAEALRREMMAQLSEDIPAVIALYDQRRYLLQAAEMAASVGRLADAAQRYKDGLASLEAARLYERIGRWREAELMYRQHLQTDPTSSVAQLGLGRILQRFERHHEACEPLAAAHALASDASSPPSWAEEARARLAYSFLQLGWHRAARVCLQSNDVEGFIEDFRARHEAASGSALGARYSVRAPYHWGYPEAYLAEDTLRDREVLLQPLHGEMSARRAYLQALTALSEPPLPGTLRMLEGDLAGRFVALDPPDGEPLTRWLQVEARAGAALRGVITQLSKVLEGAHRRGVLHGHLHPGVVLIRPGHSVWLVGFALDLLGARQETQTEGEEADSPLRYLPPEAMFGGALDLRSDFYGLGALLHRALTGAAPPADADLVASGVPESWRDALGALLAPRPTDRPANHAALRRWIERAPWSSAPSMRPRGAVRALAGDDEESGGERYDWIEDGEDGLTRLRDRGLRREVWRLEWSSAPTRDVLERLRALCQPGVGVLQRVLAADLERRCLWLEALDAPPLLDATLDPLERLGVFLRLMRALRRRHESGAALGGFAREQVRLDPDAGLRLEVAPALQRLFIGGGGEGSPEGADLDGLEAFAQGLFQGQGLVGTVEACWREEGGAGSDAAFAQHLSALREADGLDERIRALGLAVRSLRTLRRRQSMRRALVACAAGSGDDAARASRLLAGLDARRGEALAKPGEGV